VLPRLPAQYRRIWWAVRDEMAELIEALDGAKQNGGKE